MNAGTVLLGSLTIPGQPEQLHAARAFVSQALGDQCACLATAVLLTSELVTNSIQHSDSRREGETVTVVVIAVPGGVRTEVIDEGGATIPAVCPEHGSQPDLAESGRGLQLVEMLATRWGHYRDEAGALTWFELLTSPHERDPCSPAIGARLPGSCQRSLGQAGGGVLA